MKTSVNKCIQSDDDILPPGYTWIRRSDLAGRRDIPTNKIITYIKDKRHIKGDPSERDDSPTEHYWSSLKTLQ